MTDLYSNDKVRIKAEDLVRQNVNYCVSTMVSNLAACVPSLDLDACEALDVDYEDDLLPLLESKDWEAAGDYHIMQNMDADELRSYLDDQDVEYETPVEEEDADEDTPATEGTPIGVLQSLASEAAEEQGWEDFCNDMNIEPEINEVFEHWIVDRWFLRKLGEKGECTGELFGLPIWGRCTTGQSISMDHVILEIADDLLKEYPE